MKAQVEQFIRDFKSAKYYNHRLIEIRLEVERLRNKQYWGEYKGGEHTGNTMRYSVKPFDYETSDIITEYTNEAQYCVNEILKCKAVDSLSETDRAMLIDKYWLNKSPYDLADDYGYSVAGTYKHIEAELVKAMQKSRILY